MARTVTVGAAQMGPNNEGMGREEIVERMQALLDQAKAQGVQLLAFPEMALTTYFPKKIRKDFDQFFEAEIPPKALEPLLRRAKEMGIACIVAAGNSGGPEQFPASTPHVLAVSAVGKWGEFPDDSYHSQQGLDGATSGTG